MVGLWTELSGEPTPADLPTEEESWELLRQWPAIWWQQLGARMIKCAQCSAESPPPGLCRDDDVIRPGMLPVWRELKDGPNEAQCPYWERHKLLQRLAEYGVPERLIEIPWSSSCSIEMWDNLRNLVRSVYCRRKLLLVMQGDPQDVRPAAGAACAWLAEQRDPERRFQWLHCGSKWSDAMNALWSRRSTHNPLLAYMTSPLVVVEYLSGDMNNSLLKAVLQFVSQRLDDKLPVIVLARRQELLKEITDQLPREKVAIAANFKFKP